MLKTNLTPAGGCMPPAGTVPTLLQKPIAELKKLSCVAGVTSGSSQDAATAMVRIDFSHLQHPKSANTRKALDCFKDTGLALKRLLLIEGQSLRIWLQPAKTLTH